MERTAALLGIDVPPSPVDFVWDPITDGSEPWACPPQTIACYQSREEDGLSVVVSPTLRQRHELVHAVEIQGFGTSGHPTLGEGLAEYLGTLSSTLPREDFSEMFKAILAEAPKPDNYNLAMHFVGSILARHGAAKYRALRTKMPNDAGLEKFAEVFEDVYGQALDEALEEMNGKRVYAVDQFPACGAGEAGEISWASDGLLDTVIKSACGDPWFYGGGAVDGRPGFYGSYVVEIPEAGYYDLTVAGGASLGIMTGCSFDLLESAVGSFAGDTGHALLQSGRHTLAIAFSTQDEARGEASVRLEWVGPPPPP